MNDIAPNLSTVVGSAVAAKLMCCAGGLSLLANMPADNFRNLGGKRKNLSQLMFRDFVILSTQIYFRIRLLR